MRVLLLLAGLLLCVYSAPLQQQSKLLSRAKRAAEQVIFGNHQNNARVKKSGPGLATPLQPLQVLQPAAVKEDEADIDKKALVSSKVTSSENVQPEGQEDLSDDLSDDLDPDMKSHLEDEIDNEVAPPSDDSSISSQDEEDMKDEEATDSQEDAAEENLEQLLNENESSLGKEQQSFPLDIFGKNQLGSEYMDYPTYDYQYNPYLRRKRSLGQRKARAVKAEDMMQSASALESSARRSKRDLGQDVRYMWENNLDYPEVERRGYEEPELDEEREEELEEMLREEILKYNPELAEEVDNEIDEQEQGPYVPEQKGLYVPEQKAEDLALINYLYRNGYTGDDLGQDYEEELEEEGPEPWEDMGPAPEVALPQEESRGYFYPYGQYASEENVMSAPYGVNKRQYLSFVPGMRKRGDDFYPYAYGPDGRWGAMVADEVMEKRAEERMYERLLRLAAALRDRRDELEAERYYADDFPEK